MCKRRVLQSLSLSIAIVIEGCERPAPERVANEADELRLESLASLAEDAWTLDTHAIAAQVGTYATPAPGQGGAFNGADLGWAFVHRDKIWVLFGDSWFIDPVNAASLPDDALGQISLTDFPDGASVDAFARAHPAPH